MCAAAYIDSTFAQDVVEEIVHEHHRAVQIPTGVDITTVATHCLAACRRKAVRDLLLTVDVVLTIVLFFTHFLGHWELWPLVGFLAAWVIVMADTWIATYLVVVKRLNPLSFPSHAAPPPTNPYLTRRIEQLARDQRGNLTVYSGFLPFSAAGRDAGGWSFLVDLQKGREDHIGGRSSVREPTPAELYAGVEQALGALEMPNLEIRDRLFVSGSDVRYDRTLMPSELGPPLAWIEPSVVAHYMVAPTHQIRHYRCIEIVDWRGELVVTLFLRFAVRNGRLFCELNKFVLVPLKEELHRLDHLGGGLNPGNLLAMAIATCVATPRLSWRAPRVILKPLGRDLRQSGKAKEVEDDPFFDYGAPVTALDRVRSTHYRRYFQMLDKEMYVKVLERTVLDSIAEILDRHGIDTGEIVERRTTIINNGIMTKELNATNVAAGPKAGISVNLSRSHGSGGES
jgi:hypothetical protein